MQKDDQIFKIKSGNTDVLNGSGMLVTIETVSFYKVCLLLVSKYAVEQTIIVLLSVSKLIFSTESPQL